MVDHLFPLLAPLKSFVLRIGWNNNEKVQAVKHPILFISGLKDELVPPSHMQRLFDLAIRCKFKEIARILNGSHNDTWQSGGAHYMEALRNFLERVLSTADSLDSSQISNGEISSRSLD